jgi:putative FmdB family regulatory protein
MDELMVTRVYKCNKCEKEFEVQQSIKDEPLKICDCGGKLSQKYFAPGKPLIFTNPLRGAISRRFA